MQLSRIETGHNGGTGLQAQQNASSARTFFISTPRFVYDGDHLFLDPCRRPRPRVRGGAGLPRLAEMLRVVDTTSVGGATPVTI